MLLLKVTYNLWTSRIRNSHVSNYPIRISCFGSHSNDSCASQDRIKLFIFNRNTNVRFANHCYYKTETISIYKLHFYLGVNVGLKWTTILMKWHIAIANRTAWNSCFPTGLDSGMDFCYTVCDVVQLHSHISFLFPQRRGWLSVAFFFNFQD